MFIATGVLLLSFAYTLENNAYAHNISPGVRSLPVRIDNEQFSSNRANTDGGFIAVTGTLTSLATERIKVSPYIFVTPSEWVGANGVRHGTLPYYDLLAFIYPPYRDQSNWYFRVELNNLPSSIVLEPGEKVDYEIQIYPLKAGAYHVHSFFLSENFARSGLGQTILVTGSSAPTTGEITQLYLPLVLGLTSFVILIIRIMQISRENAHLARERIARVYFAAKSSLETMWLAGVLFWLATAAPYFPAIESRYAFALSASAVLAAIVIGGYVSAAAKQNARHLAFAIMTSAVSAAFCFALLFGEGWLYPYYKELHFLVDGSALFLAMIANSIIAIYFAVMARKEGKNKLTSVA
ncbi:hypothetical protein NTE_01628 [Candidatus Nitrososphaera evergladensis SR1]|uniref:Uncharacterized protein n=1 Tax=Candidatus Nitrososphaera evergladensis SR1 TaxID=1459636 RepID=A0A075MRH8_9ARCH|nr:hypothetical protein NTE_01628 [Candidatus Nitrososphaera evergladensis SR1]